MGALPVGRKLETEALIFRYSFDNEEGNLSLVESRSANGRGCALAIRGGDSAGVAMRQVLPGLDDGLYRNFAPAFGRRA